MAWRRPGGKPLSEPMMVSLLTHICVTRPQWVKFHPLWKAINPLVALGELASFTNICLSEAIFTISSSLNTIKMHTSLHFLLVGHISLSGRILLTPCLKSYLGSRFFPVTHSEFVMSPCWVLDWSNNEIGEDSHSLCKYLLNFFQICFHAITNTRTLSP